MINHSVLDLIGNTPIVEVDCFDTGPCRLFLKLESMNPGGSIKDRIARHMIERAEQAGIIAPGDTLVEATAGNTGVALAMVAALKGYKLLIVMPDKMSQEKADHLTAMGAEVLWTRSDVQKGHPEYYQDMAQRLASERERHYYIGQFQNKYNPEAHYLSTGPEIWQQMNSELDAFVAGVGTGGTITGAGGFLKEKNPRMDIVLADPNGSILAHYIETGELLKESGKWLVEGIGEDYIPSICNLDHVERAYTVTDKEAFANVRKLLKETGIFAGSSTGVLLGAALAYCQSQETPKKVLTFVCDTGSKYLSKAYNERWLKEKGML